MATLFHAVPRHMALQRPFQRGVVAEVNESCLPDLVKSPYIVDKPLPRCQQNQTQNPADGNCEILRLRDICPFSPQCDHCSQDLEISKAQLGHWKQCSLNEWNDESNALETKFLFQSRSEGSNDHLQSSLPDCLQSGFALASSLFSTSYLFWLNYIISYYTIIVLLAVVREMLCFSRQGKGQSQWVVQPRNTSGRLNTNSNLRSHANIFWTHQHSPTINMTKATAHGSPPCRAGRST